MKFRMDIEYDGSKFFGWQLQAKGSTVQEEIENALLRFYSSECKKRGFLESELTRVVTTASGRTDSGVHAKQQVISFSLPDKFEIAPSRLTAAVNGMLGKYVSATSTLLVSDSFDARLTPHVKTYSYYIANRPSLPQVGAHTLWWIKQPLNITEMIHAAKLIKGAHDFSSFRSADCSSATTIRKIYQSELTLLDDNLIVYSICGNGFLKQMVRIIVGTLVDIGLEKKRASEIPEIFAAKNRLFAGETAPAQGLTLMSVKYL